MVLGKTFFQHILPLIFAFTTESHRERPLALLTTEEDDVWRWIKDGRFA